MTTSTINFKRGSTFSYGGTFTMPAGTWTATAQLRDAQNVLIDDLDVTFTPPVSPATTHTLLIEKDAVDTAAWPTSRLRGDISFADTNSPEVVLITSTFVVNVIERLTQ